MSSVGSSLRSSVTARGVARPHSRSALWRAGGASWMGGLCGQDRPLRSWSAVGRCAPAPSRTTMSAGVRATTVAAVMRRLLVARWRRALPWLHGIRSCATRAGTCLGSTAWSCHASLSRHSPRLLRALAHAPLSGPRRSPWPPPAGHPSAAPSPGPPRSSRGDGSTRRRGAVPAPVDSSSASWSALPTGRWPA